MSSLNRFKRYKQSAANALWIASSRDSEEINRRSSTADGFIAQRDIRQPYKSDIHLKKKKKSHGRPSSRSSFSFETWTHHRLISLSLFLSLYASFQKEEQVDFLGWKPGPIDDESPFLPPSLLLSFQFHRPLWRECTCSVHDACSIKPPRRLNNHRGLSRHREQA